VRSSNVGDEDSVVVRMQQRVHQADELEALVSV